MNPKHVAAVQNSFKMVLPIKDLVAELFYERLFELDPSLSDVFPSDLTEQRKKLLAALATVVSGLSQPETVLPTVEALGARHVDYGTEVSHYATVGEALIWTLSHALKNEFTPEVHEGWEAAYTLLSEAMIKATANARVA